MAIPTPRSYNQILSDMLDAFLARFGIDKIKPGSPILSILEAAAQSDLRSTHDIFSYLNSINLDRARGDAVDKIGADEDLPRFNQTLGTGAVTITDSSFTKKSTKLYVGTPAPIVGSLIITVADGSTFPASGSIYIGRGTVNYEGPLTFTRVGNVLTLGTATQKFHNLQEPVVLAQGGNRLVAAGTIVRTAQGNANQAVEFSTQYSVIVPDGEIQVTGVSVVAKEPGLVGRINAAAIVEFSSKPFVGATVTNPLPFSNAKSTENETDYKERIRNARQSRSKGTPLAISSGVLGILAADENKSVLSASVVTRRGFPTTLYIDDGTGYEERSTGVAIEGVVDSASGGEQFFEVNNRPVAKAFLESSISEPFTLAAGAKLAIKVNGLTYKHTFSADTFRNIASATAYEVVASINGNPAVPFNARLAGNGDRFAVIADSDTGENLEVTSVDAIEIDANQWLGLSVGRVDTVLLYKNDRLLSKDGRIATLISNPQPLWAGSLITPATVILAIDNTPAATYSFTSQDFIDFSTGYATMSSTNSLDSWVTVLNARIPGITAVKSGSSIVFVSNLGANIRSRLIISGGSLVSNGMLLVGDSLGSGNDFTLDRNTGQLRLSSVLAAGDVLSVGTANTRSFIESAAIPTTNILSNAESWWVVDGQAAIISTGIAAGGNITLAAYVPSGTTPWGQRIRISGSIVFTAVHEADWAIFNDSSLNAANKGAWRVAYVDPGGTYFDIERPAATFFAQTVTLATGGLTFVRTEAPVQKVVIPTANNYTAATFAASFNTQLRGATAYVSRTTKLRVRTNSLGVGDIALVAQDVESAKMLMRVGSAVTNLTSHLGTVVAAASENGTPEFANGIISTITNSTVFVRTAVDPLLDSGHLLTWNNPLVDVDNTSSLKYTTKTAGWSVGETVTGLSSGSSGVIGSVLGGAPGGVTGTIVLTSVSAPFVAGETLSGSVSGSAAAKVAADMDPAKSRWSGNKQHGPISTTSGTTITVRNALERLPGERFYAAAPYAIGPQDDLTVVVDEDQELQRYAMQMYRRVKPATAVYGITNDLKDVDNSIASLAAGFGLSYDWLDYAAWMKARTKTHNEAGDTTKTVLYRYTRFGPEGNQAYVRYVYPITASQAISVTTDSLTDGQTNVAISIPSGAARTGLTVRNSTRIGVITTNGPDTLKTITYILGFSITTATTTKRLRIKPPQTVANFIAGDVLTGGTSGATGTVIDSQYANVAEGGYGYVTLTAGNGVAFVDGETISSPTGGVHTGKADGTQYGLVTATLDVATPGATDHGFTSHIINVIDNTNFVVGDVVVGATSRARAIVREMFSSSGLVVSELTGTFIVSELLSGTVNDGGSGTCFGVSLPNTLYMNSTSGSYSSGLKPIIGRGTGTTIQYVEGLVPLGPIATPGTVSWDIGQATTTGSTAVNGDLVNVNLLASLPTTNGEARRTIRTTTLAAQYWKGPADSMTGPNTVTSWGALNQASYLSFFPVATASAKASDFATAVNAVTNPSISAVAIGSGGVTTGVISQASFDEFSTTANKHYTLTDGINWIRTQVNPASTVIDYTFTFKDAVTATLATNSDWANEDIRLVPTTTKNVVDWLNAQAVSGLSSVAESARAGSGDHPQISTLLPGRIGSIHVQGGSSNGVSAPVFGSAASIASTYALLSVKTSDAVGLSGGQWVGVQNFVAMPKQTFAAGTVITSISTTGVVTLDSGFSTTSAWAYANVVSPGHIDAAYWTVQKQGDYVCYHSDTVPFAVMNGITEGAWVIITGDTLGTVNTRNQGQFRVVRADYTNGVFWIQNPNALEERKRMNMHFLKYDSIMPGDKILINSTILGAGNQGVWTVASIDPTNAFVFTLDVSLKTPALFTGPVTLGASAPLVQAIEGAPSRMIKKIRAIAPNTNAAYVDIKLETVAGYRQISEAAGSVLQSLDKLNFPGSLTEGVDGYRYSTGLIREVNRVAYGDPGDPSSYPGIVAAGAQVNIEGSLVKRVTCSLALRLKTGVGEKDIKVRVRSAVASVINEAKTGKFISISSLITAAESVPGVEAVTWLTPTYGAGNDLIPVQPFEKPLVLDLVQDIRISLVSE